ncbi:Signal transduction histidine kinase [Quadrisphaera granulorum]|uniref:Signal transduction histidine kinase n=1 Tax=Quadrisphaera granulorum TaxID=317664 RepID=A0A316ABS0_9ACTN|nr:ATP-binding protein [Quadrisphaera granulorum]PWJ55153.1 signal transduction histidine kinase [Quadrisphaera granulorum]SZE95662.1 Signal transduction histidine kinase [Quadrisphaera granulorum]
MSPQAAQTAARRMVGAVVVPTSFFPLLAAIASALIDGTAGPTWWAVAVLSGFTVTLLALTVVVVRGQVPDPATACLVAITLAALCAYPLFAHLAASSGVAMAPGSDLTRWQTYLVGSTPPAFGALVRRWRPRAALAACAAMAVVAAGVGQVPPPLLTAPLAREGYGVSMAAMAVAVYLVIRAMEQSSGRWSTARMAVLRAEAQAEALALAEAERGRWEAAVHDDVLSALRAGAQATTPQEVRAAAAAAAAALDHIATPPATLTVAAAVAAQQVHAAARGVRESVEVQVDSGAGTLPGRVVEAMADATAELLRNTFRHNPPGVRATVRGRLAADGAYLVVSDDGSGFDVETLPPGRLGIRVSVVGRLRSVGGDATVRSSPAAGTTVELRWPQ